MLWSVGVGGATKHWVQWCVYLCGLEIGPETRLLFTRILPAESRQTALIIHVSVTLNWVKKKLCSMMWMRDLRREYDRSTTQRWRFAPSTLWKELDKTWFLATHKAHIQNRADRRRQKELPWQRVLRRRLSCRLERMSKCPLSRTEPAKLSCNYFPWENLLQILLFQPSPP